jgi:hypothetical protein
MAEDIDNSYKLMLKNEIDKLICNEWLFINDNWKLVLNKYNHRTELKEVKNNNIKIVKEVLLNTLGYIPVFYFLNELYGVQEYPAPYKEIEKGLLLLYHIVSGDSGRDMHKFMSYTTYYSLYKKFWHGNYATLNKKVNKDLNNMFSNIKIRILSAMVNNPKPFKNVTLYIDGHDGKIKYYDPDTRSKDIKSFKLDGPGLRTQIVTDTNKMIVFISNSEKCGKGSDGTMFLKMKLYHKMHVGDCLGSDGGYNLYINKFKEDSLNEGKEFSDKNFMYPIRKENNVNLSIDELHYNHKFGAFRSEIENQFSVIASKFNRFNNNTAAMQITDIKYYNLQFKVACLLKNIWQMVEMHDIEVLPHHKLWYNEGFEFPKKDSKLDQVFMSKIKADTNINEMKALQHQILNLELDDSEYISPEEEEDVEMGEVALKHKKRNDASVQPVVVIQNKHLGDDK